MIWTGKERRGMERRKGERRSLDPLFFWTPDMAYKALIIDKRPIRDPVRPDRRSGHGRRRDEARVEFA